MYGWDRVQGAVPEGPQPVAPGADDPQIARERSEAAAGGTLIGGIWTPAAPDLPLALAETVSQRDDWLFGFV